uniref:Nanos n=1 Tax=Drosophila virilis TaxID=7244 RepID=Q24710_DROVI|nr:nanos [Drosophila virilis]
MSSFHDLGRLNMYLDTASQNISPPVSSATLSPPTTPLTPEPTMSSTQFPLLTDSNHVNMNASTAASTLLMQRQYQYHLLLQQQQQQLAFAQHQLALAASAAAANHHQEDEIAHSLKMFAFLTAATQVSANTGNGSTQDAMQDFAANGYVSDEFNCFQYNNHSSVAPQSSQLPSQVPISSAGTGGNATAEGATFPSSLAAAHWINLSNYREHLNHVWRTMSMSYMPNVAANMGLAIPAASQNNINTMGLAVQPDHMRNVGNLNISNNKLNKRYNSGKFKELVPRHCVFCENNNEPEAVVNSHTVRDAYGRVLCPKLRTYVCPICGASGDSAHTIKYCPKKPIVTMEDAIKAESFRLAKSNYYKQQMKV